MLCGTNQSAPRARPASDNLHKNARHGGRLYTRGWCSWDHSVSQQAQKRPGAHVGTEERQVDAIARHSS